MRNSFHTIATISKEEVLHSLASNEVQGLGNDQAAVLLKKYGFNIIETDHVAWWHILLRQLRSPFIYLLFGAALLSFFLADLEVILVTKDIESVAGWHRCEIE